MVTEITYNGVKHSLDDGNTATLACSGKKMKSDLVVLFGTEGNITYNGTQTDVEAEKTATIHCGGKKMKSDLVIVTVEGVTDKIVYDGSVQLPPISAELLEQYPYAWIRKNTTSGYYDLLLSDEVWYYNNGVTSAKKSQWYRVGIATVESETQWTDNTSANTYSSWGLDTARTVLWSSYDIPNGYSVSDIYFKGDKSLPSDIFTTINGRWKFNSTVNLPLEYNGTTIRYDVNFSVEGDTYEYFRFAFTKDCPITNYTAKDCLSLWYRQSGSNSSTEKYIYSKSAGGFTNGWDSSKIYVFDNQTVTKAFYTWFTANATQQ